MLDTNIVIYTIRNRPPAVREAFVAHYGQICISTVTFMELIYGAEKSTETMPFPVISVERARLHKAGNCGYCHPL